MLFGLFDDLITYYSFLYNKSFSALEITPKYHFLMQNRAIHKRYKKDYKEFLRFEKTEKRALKAMWKAREKGNKELEKKWAKKVKFLHFKKSKIAVLLARAEEKENNTAVNNR